MTVLRYYGVDAADALTKVGTLYTDRHDGTDPAVFATWFRSIGWNLTEGYMEPDTVRHHTDAGRPVIMLVTMQVGHWIVARGVSRRTFYYHDPFSGRGSMKVDELMPIWCDSNRYGTRFRQWGIVAGP